MYLIFFYNSSTLDIPVTPGESFYVQPSSESSSEVSFDDIDTEHALSKPVEALNTYLVSRDLSPICRSKQFLGKLQVRGQNAITSVKLTSCDHSSPGHCPK